MTVDIEEVGKATAYLRKRAGYTQMELAERVGVSDKAVSKWERGLGLPDTSIIGKVAILLDTDTDSLLAGDVIHHDTSWRGLLLVDENPYGIGLGTVIYDKPLVYFLLGYFMLMGVRNIDIVCTESDRSIVEKEFGTGAGYGLNISCMDRLDQTRYQNTPGNTMIVSGRTIIYGVDQTRFFQKAMFYRDRVTILSLPKKKMGHPSRIYFNEEKKIVSSEDEGHLVTQYAYHQIPVIFCPNNVIEGVRTDISSFYQAIMERLDGEKLYTVALDRGFVEMSIDTWDDVMDASMFVKSIQNACGMQIYCVEEIAWRRGLISGEQLRTFAKEKSDTEYGRYIQSFLSEVNSK